MAIIDTGFCPEKISSAIKIEPALDLTNSVQLDCQKVESDPGRFHGQLVLKEFLKYFDNKSLNLHIYPLVIFDKRGNQKKEYWLSAIEWVKKNNIDFVLTASGLITSEIFLKKLPCIWFVPSGRIGPGIKSVTKLFPQELAPQSNLFLIGDYYDGRQVLFDQALLYKDKIDYFFPSEMKGFTGTSRAVAEAAARALNICSIHTLRECLKKNKKVYLDNLSHNKVITY